jgi:hypothetical protein
MRIFFLVIILNLILGKFKKIQNNFKKKLLFLITKLFFIKISYLAISKVII